MTCPDPSRRHAGYTLAELLIVVTLSSIVVSIALRGWAPLSRSTLALRDRAAANAELRLTIDALLDDFGCAANAEQTVDGDLWIVREQVCAELLGTWEDDADAGVLWTFDSGDVLRIDLTSGQTALVGRLETFEVTEEEGVVDVRMVVGAAPDAYEYTLSWEL